MNRQTSATNYTFRTLLAATVSFAALGFIAAPAFAGKRKAAPIVYAGQGGSATAATPRNRTDRARTQRRSTRQTAVHSAPQAAPSTVSASETPGRRVEFRYPDQPDRFYGAGGARAANDAPPLSFSSSETAISQTAARQYAVSAPQPLQSATPAPVSDPAITSGGFDARAAAQRVADRSNTKEVSPYISSAGVADFSSAQITEVQVEPTTEVPVSGAVQHPSANPVYDQTGPATVFDADLNGQPTANGEVLDMNAMIAAHPTLPLPSLVQVINLENNTEIVVRVNDRGPFDGNGLIELSARAADVIGVQPGRSANVRVRYLGPAPVAANSAPVQQQQSAPSGSAPSQNRPTSTPVPSVETELAGGRSAPVTQTAVYTAQPAPAVDGYYVQLGSFSNIGNAQGLHAKVAATSSVKIVPVRVNGSDFFRVMAGPVSNRQDADLLRSYIANQGIADGVVINPS